MSKKQSFQQRFEQRWCSKCAFHQDQDGRDCRELGNALGAGWCAAKEAKKEEEQVKNKLAEKQVKAYTAIEDEAYAARRAVGSVNKPQPVGCIYGDTELAEKMEAVAAKLQEAKVALMVVAEHCERAADYVVLEAGCCGSCFSNDPYKTSESCEACASAAEDDVQSRVERAEREAGWDCNP